jgi:hypothetical protein
MLVAHAIIHIYDVVKNTKTSGKSAYWKNEIGIVTTS